jgi:hypothetical protein
LSRREDALAEVHPKIVGPAPTLITAKIIASSLQKQHPHSFDLPSELRVDLNIYACTMAELIMATWERLTNVPHHVIHSVDGMDLKSWIRLVAAVGTYLLLRPYLIKLGARKQEKEYEKIDAETTAAATSADPKAKISPNALRDSVGKVVEVDSGSEGEVDDGAPQWGKKAKVRQRKVVKRIQEAMEQKGREDDEGNSILDKFVDYEEGKDGW